MEKYINKFNQLSTIKKIGLICCVGFVELIVLAMLFGDSTPETANTNNTEINALQNVEDTTTKKSINTTDRTAEENSSAESSNDSADNFANSIDNSADQVEPTVTPEPVYTPPVEQTEKIVYVGNSGTKYHRQNCRTLKNGSYEMTLTDAQNEGREACKVCNP